MRSDCFVYISGPMTAKDGYSKEENTAQGLKMYLNLLSKGIPCFCPHLSGAFPTAWEIPWEIWLAYDEAVIDRCAHVLMLRRWETSAGAVRERQYAFDRGIPTYDDLDTLLKVINA